jgi:hypothetical protein
MDKLNPDALAEWGEEEGAPADQVRANVQRDVTPQMITDYVVAEDELPQESAEPFGSYLHEHWNDYVEYEEITQRALIAGALEYWRGGR